MTLSLSDQARVDLQTLLESVQPASLLLAGGARDYEALVNEAAGDCQLQNVDLDSLCRQVDDLAVFDVVLLAEVLENLDKYQAETLIGRLRDLHSRHLFMFVRMGQGWSDLKSYWRRNDLLAHGFSLYGRYKEDDREYHLYRFELETYKNTPEWLNSQYWANPELFDKFRW